MTDATENPDQFDTETIPGGGPVRVTLRDGNEAYGTVSGIVKKRLPRKVGDPPNQVISMESVQCLEVTHKVNAKADDSDDRRARLAWPLDEIARVEAVDPSACQGCG